MIYKAPTSIKYEGATRKGEITYKNLAIANRSTSATHTKTCYHPRCVINSSGQRLMAMVS